MKRKLVVLINEETANDSYLGLLKLKYEVEVVKLGEILKKKEKGEVSPQVDLVLFTGGEDVDPNFYNERVGKYTSANPARDSRESQMFTLLGNKIPKLGICRGAQFLTVMSGGRLIQHVENHGIGGTHPITFNHLYGSKKMPMTSTHHQMMYPYGLKEGKEYILCAHSTNHLSSKYWNGQDKNIEIKEDFLEPEIVFYPRTNSLGIQGHPESGIMKEVDKMFILNYIDNILKL